MLILAVDTTTPSGSAALLDGERLIVEFGQVNPGTHSAKLMRAVDFMLDAAGKKIGDVEAFAVAAGPGSFTGIRIGLGTVKALAFASGRPVIGVSTLEAMAEKALDFGAGLVCPLIDARKDEIYAALYEKTASGLAEVVPAGAYAPDDFFSRLPGGRTVSFIGNGLELYGKKLGAYVTAGARFPERSGFIAAEIGRLGCRGILAGRAVTSGELEPVYLRRSQAEEKCRP